MHKLQHTDTRAHIQPPPFGSNSSDVISKKLEKRSEKTPELLISVECDIILCVCVCAFLCGLCGSVAVVFFGNVEIKRDEKHENLSVEMFGQDSVGAAI